MVKYNALHQICNAGAQARAVGWFPGFPPGVEPGPQDRRSLRPLPPLHSRRHPPQGRVPPVPPTLDQDPPTYGPGRLHFPRPPQGLSAGPQGRLEGLCPGSSSRSHSERPAPPHHGILYAINCHSARPASHAA